VRIRERRRKAKTETQTHLMNIVSPSLALLLLCALAGAAGTDPSVRCSDDGDCCADVFGMADRQGVCINGTCAFVGTPRCSTDADCAAAALSIGQYDPGCASAECGGMALVTWKCTANGTCAYAALRPPHVATGAGQCPACFEFVAYDGTTPGRPRWGTCVAVEGCCADELDCDRCHECVDGVCTAIAGCCVEDVDCGSACGSARCVRAQRNPRDTGVCAAGADDCGACADRPVPACAVGGCDAGCRCCRGPRGFNDECADDDDCRGWSRDPYARCVATAFGPTVCERAGPEGEEEDDCTHPWREGWHRRRDCHGLVDEWYRWCDRDDQCPDGLVCCGGGECAEDCSTSPYSCGPSARRCGDDRACCEQCVDGDHCCSADTPCSNHGAVPACTVVRDISFPGDGLDGPEVADVGVAALALGADGVPEFNPEASPVTFSGGNATFWCWFHDCADVSITVPTAGDAFVLRDDGTGLWILDPRPRTTAGQYLPIDHEGFGDQGRTHNYHTSTSACFSFAHVAGGGRVSLRTDDDLWLFLDGRLVAGLGGIQPARAAVVAVGAGLAVGSVHELCVFKLDRSAATAPVLEFAIREDVLPACGDRGGSCRGGLTCDACVDSDDCRPGSVCCGGHCTADAQCCADTDCVVEDPACFAARCDCPEASCVVTPLVTCDDLVPCTDDACHGGRCTNVPVDAQCADLPAGECGAAVCDPSAGGCTVALRDAACPSRLCATVECAAVSGMPTCVYTAVPNCPERADCETAFARYTPHNTCFLDIPGVGSNRWGWTNGPFPAGTTSAPLSLYAGAAHCVPTSGAVDGATFSYDGTTATIVLLHPASGVTITEVHAFVGTDLLPRKHGEYTVSPGQFPFVSDAPQSYPFVIRFTDLPGTPVYVVVHAVACGEATPSSSAVVSSSSSPLSSSSSPPSSSSSPHDPCDGVLCSDFNECTTDSCVEGTCVHTPGACAAWDMECCGATCVDRGEPSDESCREEDDECTTSECDPDHGCVRTLLPPCRCHTDLDCDKSPCATERCDLATGECFVDDHVDCTEQIPLDACARVPPHQLHACAQNYVDVCIGGHWGGDHPAPVVCNQTTGLCPPVKTCEDSDCCTEDECVQRWGNGVFLGYQCEHRPVECPDDGLPWTVDRCNPSTCSCEHITCRECGCTWCDDGYVGRCALCLCGLTNTQTHTAMRARSTTATAPPASASTRRKTARTPTSAPTTSASPAPALTLRPSSAVPTRRTPAPSPRASRRPGRAPSPAGSSASRTRTATRARRSSATAPSASASLVRSTAAPRPWAAVPPPGATEASACSATPRSASTTRSLPA
jgi:fibro-slime domain-containing protein